MDHSSMPSGLLDKLLNPNSNAQWTRAASSASSSDEVLLARELRRCASPISAILDEHTQPGDRVIVETGNVLEFVVAFFAIFLRGRIAVPVPPVKARSLERENVVSNDCEAKLWLTTNAGVTHLQALNTSLHCAAVPPLSDLKDSKQEIDVLDQEIAFIQYTSGSTGSPKGVVVTVDNLEANLSAIQGGFATDDISTFINWLPKHHDMGLVTSVFLPVWSDFDCVEISTVRVAARPKLWLQAISRYRADTSGGPAAMFQRCWETTKDEEVAELDLSCWVSAFCGSDFIPPRTLASFATKFGKAGFRATSLTPCYGMAENTLMVTSVALDQRPNALAEDGSVVDWLEDEGAFAGAYRVMCGPPRETTVRVAEEVSGKWRVLEDRMEGEILIAGASLAERYWGKPTLGEIAVLDGEPYFRTGDRGIMVDDELVVTGRTKELIVLNGRNIWLADIDELLETGLDFPACAYIADLGPRESLGVCVLSMKGRFDIGPKAAKEQVDGLLTAKLGIQSQEVFISGKLDVPRTSSGKVERFKIASLKHEEPVI